ncbi:hypothetical protein GIB67_027585 [Kingdonia uniflora]|uniref:Uncharacterized protein n=1 Tax=Kingdonia uniflora TaxID=39325 RepID=A0A7J7NKT9_9MAGN|nr:hypothetical protein GIB67_027585 [Kingdonia uniflora]
MVKENGGSQWPKSVRKEVSEANVTLPIRKDVKVGGSQAEDVDANDEHNDFIYAEIEVDTLSKEVHVDVVFNVVIESCAPIISTDGITVVITSKDFVTSENATTKDLAVLVDDCWLKNHERGVLLDDGPTEVAVVNASEEVSSYKALPSSKEAPTCKALLMEDACKEVKVDASKEVPVLVDACEVVVDASKELPNLHSQEDKARGMDDFKAPFEGITKDMNGRKTCYKQDWTTKIYLGFSLFQLTRIERTCALAGLFVLRLMPELIVVALLYGKYQLQMVHDNMGSKSENIAMIFNMGAGYCDVCVIATTEGVLQIKALSAQDAVIKLSLQDIVMIDVDLENGFRICGCSNIPKVKSLVLELYKKDEAYMGMDPLNAVVYSTVLEGAVASGIMGIPSAPKGILEISVYMNLDVSNIPRVFAGAILPQTHQPVMPFLEVMMPTVDDGHGWCAEALVKMYGSAQELFNL